MTHGSLFSGVGGFDLSAEWMGWENKFHCEWDKFCQQVLKYYWPNAKSYGDIDETGFTVWRGLIDVLSGGFPCQPYSAAGKRKGKEDNRHKWPQMLRAIREIQPRWIVGENVYGLVNWSGGLVFDEVQADLENEGYEVTPYILPACAVNAPHRRDRIWFVAYTESLRVNRTAEYENNNRQSGERRRCDIDNISEISKRKVASDTGNEGLQGSKNIGNIGEIREDRNKFFTGLLPSNWEVFPTQSPVRGRNDGIPGDLVGTTFSKHRNESIKAFGNAVVPEVPYQIFKAIEQYELNSAPKAQECDATEAK